MTQGSILSPKIRLSYVDPNKSILGAFKRLIEGAQIMKKPGRELDALVAEKVMGWIWVKRTDLNRTPEHPGFTPWTRYLTNLPLAEWQVPTDESLPIDYPFSLPEYSTDIAAAWEAVEKLLNLFQGVYRRDATWIACFDNGNRQYAYADTAPHAICLAALKTIDDGL
jgi:hypothetical protein